MLKAACGAVLEVQQAVVCTSEMFRVNDTSSTMYF